MRPKKTIAKWLLLIMTVLVILAPTVTVQADTDVNENVRDARKGILQIQLTYNDIPLYGGTAFLINEDTILTCHHVVHLDAEQTAAVQSEYPDFKAENLKIKVVVMNDIILDAKIVNESQVADFAILELEQPIYDRTPLKLNKDENVSETQKVYGLGFPAAVVSAQNLTAYTYQDVTVSDGRVTKITDISGVKYVQHSANLTPGDSGGPLVAEDGSVIAIDRGVATEEDDYSYSVAISQLRSALDALGISYTDAGSGSNPSQNPTENVTSDIGDNESTKPTEEDTTKKAPVISNTDNDNKKTEEASGLSPMVLAAIIGVIVVVLIVVIILIVTLGKGKKGAAQPPTQIPPITGQRPVPPVQQPPYVDEGMAATTVLNEGAGETTVLNGGGGQMQLRTLIRVKTGERIQINQPEYTIGKERRRVNYCISDNNSISRVHAKLVNRGGQLFLIDMNATNGTFINGTKLSPNQEVRVSAGDRFRLADEEFQIQS